MKIMMSEKEIKEMKEVLNYMDVIVEANGCINAMGNDLEQEMTVDEKDIINMCKGIKFMLNKTEVATHELVTNAKEVDKNTLIKLRDKIVTAVTDCFLLGNKSTRKLYNSVIYYIAVFKKAYNELIIFCQLFIPILFRRDSVFFLKSTIKTGVVSETVSQINF